METQHNTQEDLPTREKQWKITTRRLLYVCCIQLCQATALEGCSYLIFYHFSTTWQCSRVFICAFLLYLLQLHPYMWLILMKYFIPLDFVVAVFSAWPQTHCGVAVREYQLNLSRSMVKYFILILRLAIACMYQCQL